MTCYHYCAMQFQISNDIIRIITPSSYDFGNTLRFVCELSSIPLAKEYVFDFSPLGRTGHAPPFGLLFAATAIRQFRNTRGCQNPPARFRATNVEHGYATHMGFWKAMGVKAHQDNPEAHGSQNYRPISSLELAKLKTIRQNNSIRMSQLMDSIALEQSSILTRNSGCPIQNALQYSLRELFRNIAEHSKADRIWYAMQYWPNRDEVELAVLDEGCGILASLNENPEYALESEKQAIVKATQRGVTRMNPSNIQHPAMWDGYGAAENENSGYGLFVIKQLCSRAGELALISNQSCVRFSQSNTRYDSRPLSFKGTAIRLFMKPNRLDEFLHDILNQIVGGKSPSKLTPSLLAKLTD